VVETYLADLIHLAALARSGGQMPPAQPHPGLTTRGAYAN
jgi:hypothetical protein